MSQYQHGEAFALMRYTCKECRHSEVIWNSRDGVTPFCFQCPSCGESTITHVDFWMDTCVPDWQLKPFQKFWRDGTPEEAEAIIRARISSMAAAGQPTSPERVEELLASFRRGEWHEFRPGWPILDVQLPSRAMVTQ